MPKMKPKHKSSTSQKSTEVKIQKLDGSTLDLKTRLQQAVINDEIVLLHRGDREKEWKDNISCQEKNIVILDCKLFKEEPKDRDINQILAALRIRVGEKPELNIESFENWGKTQTSNIISCYPTNKGDIQKLVTAAAAENVRVRCAGSKHSWAPLFSDDKQLLLYVEKMKSDYPDGARIRIADKEKREVDIMTGVTTEDFKEFQLKNKLHLPANVILEVVQMVSVVATGCHGVGWNQKTPSDHIVRMRIFDCNGELRIYDKSDEKMLKAVSANFGCFGIIFDMTIKLEDEIIVSTTNQYENLKDLFDNPDKMKDLVENNWSVELFWFPFNSCEFPWSYSIEYDHLWVRVINKEKTPHQVKPTWFYCWKDAVDYLSQEGLKEVTPCIVKDPEFTPLYSWTAFKALRHIIYPSETIYQELPHAIHFRKYTHLAPVYDMEFAFNVKEDFSNVQKIIKVVTSKIEHYEKKNGYPLNIALEMRWMGYSESYMCPAIIGNPNYGGSGHVFYIEVLSVVGTKGWEEFCKEVGREWMDLGGVPHLAKQWDFLPGIEDHYRKMIGKSMEEFRQQLEKSGADPNRIFLNERLEKLIFQTK